MEIVDIVREIYRREPNLLEIRDPITVVGDIHGQYFDLLKMLSIVGEPADNKFLFLGDYVDRGSFSIEVIALLFSMKIAYPQTFLMIRGNHECRQMTSFFNFRAECIYKYDIEVYERIMECFDSMPIACLINNKFLGLHGGISPELRSLNDLNRIDRFVEPPKAGLYCDLLWSDPVDVANGKTAERFKHNDVRGCSFFFNVDAVNGFLKRNNLISVVRAHEA